MNAKSLYETIKELFPVVIFQTRKDYRNYQVKFQVSRILLRISIYYNHVKIYDVDKLQNRFVIHDIKNHKKFYLYFDSFKDYDDTVYTLTHGRSYCRKLHLILKGIINAQS